ncbi:DNA (cytosine-5-)-methyltransferase [Treponema pectinovorum]|uniref:DNA (cytosine-5-)-methyltransferase n=1 Tax=Treponema pectinovorum TaxID=164 RepID=UPI0011F1D8F5|nr:DNA (cytosine-5-)-methyltransferase [Treponema pectinovorum]
MLYCASFFAGVGGIDIGFEGYGNKKSDFFKVAYANEIDPFPIVTYELNSPDIEVDNRDIKDVVKDLEDNRNAIPNFQVMLAGFPCQAFSIAGYRQGFNDEKGRGTLFFELIKIIRIKKPDVVFLENVKNLVSHNNGDTFATIIDALKKEGFNAPHYKVLNAMDYGNVPQNRERIYIVAFRNKEASTRFHFPNPIERNKQLSDIIDFNTKLNDKYYYTKGKYQGNIYEKLKNSVTSKNTVYQWRRHYVRQNMSGVIPTLTANMGTGGHNVPLVFTDNGIRKLTPHECFNAQGFPADFKLPSNMAESRIYKQAGNSVCVSVINKIALEIQKALEG